MAQTTPTLALAPAWAPMPAVIPAARDVDFAGTLKINVDLTDTDRRIIRVKETIPVSSAGDLILLPQKWLPGDHEPDGIAELQKQASFTFTTGGTALKWTRDTLEVNAFHVSVPAGVSEMTAEFQYLAPVTPDIGRIVVTPDMANLQWTFATQYPAGYYVSRIPVVASLKLPKGWQQGSGLDV